MKKSRRIIEPEEHLERFEKKYREEKKPNGTEIIVEKKRKGVSKAMQSLIKDFKGEK